MRVKATTRVRSMVRTYPQLEDVLGWHDIEVDDDVLAMTIAEVCDEFGLDLDEVLEDIQASLRDSAGEGWPVVRDEDDEDEADDDSEFEDPDAEAAEAVAAAAAADPDDADLDDEDDEDDADLDVDLDADDPATGDGDDAPEAEDDDD